MDIGFQVVARDGNREVEEGERNIRDGPGELNVGVEGVGEVDELFELLVRARGGADTVIDVMEEEVGDVVLKAEYRELGRKLKWALMTIQEGFLLQYVNSPTREGVILDLVLGNEPRQ
eukprot:g28167.t1